MVSWCCRSCLRSLPIRRTSSAHRTQSCSRATVLTGNGEDSVYGVAVEMAVVADLLHAQRCDAVDPWSFSSGDSSLLGHYCRLS